MDKEENMIDYEIRIVNNYISNMSKAYRKRTINWCVVRDILLLGTSTSGRTSSIEKCRELRINPWEYNLKED